MRAAPAIRGEFGSRPHASKAAAVANGLRTDAARGLSAGDAADRLASVGPNRLAAPQRPAYGTIAVRQLLDPLVALLVGAAIVSGTIGDGFEATVIAAIVVLNTVLGFTQEAGAERAVLALRNTVARRAAVVRDGREFEVSVEEVVPGDLIVIREGDRVPADARLVAAERLEVDESVLTGESVPVAKSVESSATEAPLAERTSMIFASTAVTRGRGRALVTATGVRTEVGTVDRLSAAAKPPTTPLQERLGRLSGSMVAVGLGVTLLLTTGMLARGASFEEAFLVGVAVAVAAVPEGLGATVTIALAQGARAMAASGAIVRRLAAVETIGAATVIAADKTGTLTVNQLRVEAVAPSPGRTVEELLEVGVLASTADVLEDAGSARIAGDPVDGAFLLAAMAAGISDPRSTAERQVVLEIPFDPTRARQTAAYLEDGRFRIVVKGAPENLLARSRLGAATQRGYADSAATWAAEGLRVLAVGERWADELPANENDIDADIELVGLVGLRDPLRPTAAESVRRARAAGLKVAMLTGDHPLTAASIAAGLELGDCAPVTGDELATMSDTELRNVAATSGVFARVTPADKLRLVETLQDAGHVVAVTGDGINDTPALRRADVGVAMGASGTEAAREAADIVLTDDDFSTIVRAIREGRRIDANVRKFVAFLLSANLGEVVLFAVCILGGLGAPMTVAQVLVVNLLTDGLPAVALSRDPALPGTMRQPPHGRGRLFSSSFQLALVGAGAAVGFAATCAFVLGRGIAPDTAQTMAFVTIAVAELALVFALRSTVEAAWRGPRNAALGLSVLASMLVVVLALYLPSIASLVGTTSLGVRELAVAAGVALVPAGLFEVGKAVRRCTDGPVDRSANAPSDGQAQPRWPGGSSTGRFDR
ncbi:MAG TPA: cation-transporting P-type ATPase [Gaiella sp.]|jgi:Ca2+-transporting ATPase